jgi:hypothetical protein
MEEAEANRLLQFGVAVDLDVGALPEIVEVLPLLGEQPSQPRYRAQPAPPRPVEDRRRSAWPTTRMRESRRRDCPNRSALTSR